MTEKHSSARLSDKGQASVLDTLRILYPFRVLLLSLFPTFIGLFINYQLVDTRQIAILFVWIPVFTLPYLLSRKKVFYYLLVLLCFIDSFVNLGHWVLIKSPVSASGLFVLFNTNPEEAAGFARLKFGYEYLLFLPYLALFFLAVRYPPVVRRRLRRKSYYIAAIAGMITLVFLLENAFHGRFVRKGVPVLAKTTISFAQEVRAYKQLESSLQMRRHQIEATAFPSDKPQVTLLIMGESTNRNHMSLYGYDRKTNPLLQQFDDLIVYDNVVSGYAHTMASIPASLSQANLDNHLKPPHSITLAEVFQAAGFRTYWLSNQSPLGVWDNMVTLFARQYQELDFVNTSGSSSPEALVKRSYDGKLFLPLIKALSKKANRKFIVVHLMGAHAEYDKRYPPAFDVFKDNRSASAQTIAAYDNAIRYNDYVVDSLLKIFRSYCVREKLLGAAVYVSDHGENIYTVGDYAGHDYTGKMPKCLVEIPFLVWLSPAYQNTFPEKSEMIREHHSLPFVTDDLFYALIDLSGIKTSVFLPQRSIFHQQFDNNRKRILEDGLDYDED